VNAGMVLLWWSIGILPGPCRGDRGVPYWPLGSIVGAEGRFAILGTFAEWRFVCEGMFVYEGLRCGLGVAERDGRD
jgi:hypothetical protein